MFDVGEIDTPMKTRPTRRWIVEYIPKSDVQKVHDKNRAAIEAGASVWDFCPPEYMTKERDALTEAEALEIARRLLPLDEFREIHVFEQELRKFGSYESWEIARRAVLYEGDTAFYWEDYR